MEMARPNLSSAKARMKILGGVLGLLFFQIWTAAVVLADQEVTKIELGDKRTSNVTIQQKDQKYSALLQLVLPSHFPAAIWSCEYQASKNLHLDFEGKLSVGVDTRPIMVTADPDAQPAFIVFNCMNQDRRPRTATIDVKLVPEAALGENVIRLGDSRPVQIKLTPEGDHYHAKLDFIGGSSFNCTYPSSSDWQLTQDGTLANGALLNVMPGRTKVDLIVLAAVENSWELPISLKCGDYKGESALNLNVLLPPQLSQSPYRHGVSISETQSQPARRDAILVGLLALAVGGCGALYRLLQKTRCRQNIRIEFDDKSLEGSHIFDLVPGITQSITLRAPKGYDNPKVPVGKYVSVEAGEQHQDKSGAEADAVHSDRESENGQGRRWTYNLILKPDAKDSGAEILWFTAKPVEANSLSLAFPIFVHWNAPAQPELIHNGNPAQPVQAATDLKAEILALGAQLEERDQRLSRQLERLLEHTANNPDGTLEFRESLNEAKKEILESLYSEVNRATGDSLGEIRDAIKKQIREDFSKQLSDIGKLGRPGREGSVRAERNKGASKSGVRINSEH